MIIKLLPLAIFCAVILLLLFLERKCWFGFLLNKNIKPYYNRLIYHLKKISGCKYTDDLIRSAVKDLKTMYEVYKKPPRSDAFNLAKDIFKNYNNYEITNSWAIFYIFTYISNSNNKLLNTKYFEEKIAILRKNNFKGIPQTFLQRFNIK